jgi:hypothetical protein
LRRSSGRAKLAVLVFLTVFVGAAALAVSHIVSASGDVVYADTWGHIDMIGHFLSGRLSLAELYSPHNENRPILLNLILLASAKYDHLNLVHIEYLSIVFCIVTICVIMYFGRHMFVGLPHILIVFSIVSLLMLSLVQWENLLLPVNVVFFSTMTFSVSSIFFMHRHLVHRPPQTMSIDFATAVLLSVLALFSMGGGTLIWIINAVQILLCWALFKRPIVYLFAIYAAVACISIALYMRDLHQSGDILHLIVNPTQTTQFIIIGLGSAIVGLFSNEPAIGVDMFLGAFLLLVYAAVAIKFFKTPASEQEASLGVFCLLLLGLAEEALICLGRLPQGVSYGAASRYATLTMISPIAAFILLATYTHGSRIDGVLAVLLGGIIVLFTALADREEIKMTEARRQYSQDLQRLLREGQIKEADQAKLEWDKFEDIVNGNRILKQFGLSLHHSRSGSSP